MTHESRLADLLITEEKTLRDALLQIDRTGRGIVLVVGAGGALENTITDGDLRRAILRGSSLEAPLAQLRRERPPVVAKAGASRRELAALMRARKLRQIPLVDSCGRPQELVLAEDLLPPEQVAPYTAVVMAGGLGSRMLPLTAHTPKPLLPIAGKPLVERTIQQLKAAGIQQVYLTTHYKADAFPQYFGAGENHGLAIRYIQEQSPLGTAGALSHVAPDDRPLLVVNGDIVTDLNYRSMMSFHRECVADLTVAIRHYEFRVPYGVVKLEETSVSDIVEKPVQGVFVNAGIYIVAREICDLVPAGSAFDMPDLIRAAIAASKKVVAFPISEYWIDVGEPQSYSQAQQDAAEHETA